MAELSGKLRNQNFASVFSGLGSFVAGAGLDMRWRGTAPGVLLPVEAG